MAIKKVFTKKMAEKAINRSKDVVIPFGIEKIEDLAFFEMEKMRYVFIPNTVKYIGFKAFAFCENLWYFGDGDGLG